jgi:hypothetical protein
VSCVWTGKCKLNINSGSREGFAYSSRVIAFNFNGTGSHWYSARVKVVSNVVKRNRRRIRSHVRRMIAVHVCSRNCK